MYAIVVAPAHLCFVKDLTADQFDISVPQLWYPADPSRYDRSGSANEPAESPGSCRDFHRGLAFFICLSPSAIFQGSLSLDLDRLAR